MSAAPSLLQAALVAAAATALGHRVAAVLRNGGPVTLALVLAPLLMPLGIVGYAYASLSLSLTGHPWLAQALYLALLCGHLTPLAALTLAFGRPALDPPARRCYQLAGRRRWSFLLRGPLAPGLAAGGLVGLLAFADFELASLLGIDRWTIRLFDAQAGGLPITQTLRLAMLPAATQAIGLALLLALLWRVRLPTRQRTVPVAAGGQFARGYCALALLLIVLGPLAIILRGTLSGLPLLLEQFVIGRELAASSLLAACAAGLSYLLASWLADRRRWWAAALLSVPGLLGPLLLSLCLLALFQLPLLDRAYATPVPLVCCLTLLLLPYALVLHLLTASGRPSSAAHLAKMLPDRTAARGLRWQLELRGQFLAIALLFCLAYFDLIAAAVLQSSMTPVTVRLYNQMHYGQSAGLSAMVCASLALPVLLLALGYATRRIWIRV